MNNNKFGKLDWVNIVILKNFQDYFYLKELQSLSKLSKIIRLKLKPILFKSIRLLNQKKYLNGTFVEFFNSKSFDKLSRICYTDTDEIQKNLSIQKCISDTNSELQDIKRFTNNLFIYGVKRSGHHFSPILANFINLSILKIHHSIVQYSIFQKLGEYFPKLKTFKLFRVVLSKGSISSDNLNEIIFPLSLKNLSIWCVEVADSVISAEHCKAVLNVYKHYARSEYVLPNIHLPSLKNLQFLRCASKNNGLENFLETNSNLEELSIDTFSSSLSKTFKSLKSLDLEQIYQFENLESLIVHHTIKTLKINSGYAFYCKNFEKICLMCPSIEFLEFSIGNFGTYQEVFDDYLIPTLKKLRNLKTLELQIEVGDDDVELIDINHFPQIEKIILVIEDLSFFRILFEKNFNLKEIEFNANFNNINKEEFLENYSSYTEWKFKFYDRKILGNKIKQ